MDLKTEDDKPRIIIEKLKAKTEYYVRAAAFNLGGKNGRFTLSLSTRWHSDNSIISARGLGSIPGLIESYAVTSTVRHCCDVSSELCYPMPRR